MKIWRFIRNLFSVQLPVWFIVPLVGFALVVGLSGGYFGAERLQTPTTCPETPDVCTTFSNFWRAWDIAKQNYVDPQAIKPQEMTDGAIEGMLDSLGDEGHTRYLSAEEATKSQESLRGRFEGIGAYIDVRNEQPIIVQPIENSPAERAGIRPGDIILKVNGTEVHGITIDELQNRVRGPKGSQLTMTLQHEGEELPYDVQLTREEIKVPSVTWSMLPDKVAYIKLNQFSEPSSEEMEQALVAAKSQGMQSIVLDLRNNPGGIVDELVSIAGQFLPSDTTVLLEEHRDGQRTPYKTKGNGSVADTPLVVLVNNNSASAAEILAGALKENNRAKVVGVSTFGTATVLRQFNLDGGAQLLLGTSQWLTPDGHQVRGVGIEPTDVVALPANVLPLSPSDAAKLNATELRQSQDTQLVAGLKLLDAVAGRQ